MTFKDMALMLEPKGFWNMALLILLGFLFSAPLAWIIMNKFLEEFAYKITISPSIFIIGLCSTLLIAMRTVGYKSFRAAIVNPTKSLRSNRDQTRKANKNPSLYFLCTEFPLKVTRRDFLFYRFLK